MHRRIGGAVLAGMLAAACGSADHPGAVTPTAGGGGSGAAAGGAGGHGGTEGGAGSCPEGMRCPTEYPYHDDGDTSQSSRSEFAGYSCAPEIDESGPEVIYQVSLPHAGFLSAAVDDSASGVDVDLHLLSDLDPGACIDRGNRQVGAHLGAGTYYLVADTFVDGGEAQAGPYGLDIGYIVPPLGDCSMTSDLVQRLSGPDLQLPITGPMVLEAHLVTGDDGFGSDWPQAIDEGIEDHYTLSFGSTDFVMARSQPWCPQESSQYGQGSTGAKVPVADEAWYLCMLWANRPPGGTRMIVQRPEGGPAVVVSAGYETGPGDTDDIGGTTEEVHFYLGTGHLSELRIGFAADQNLPLGPIQCE